MNAFRRRTGADGLGHDRDPLTATIGGFIYAIPTGVEGNPRPISTIVKQMDPHSADRAETADAGPDGATSARAGSDRHPARRKRDPAPTLRPGAAHRAPGRSPVPQALT